VSQLSVPHPKRVQFWPIAAQYRMRAGRSALPDVAAQRRVWMVWFPELELEETMLPHGEWAVVSSGAAPTEEQAKKVIIAYHAENRD
jgi:hypothetical protein